MRHFGGARLLAVLLALIGPVPAFASHWIRESAATAAPTTKSWWTPTRCGSSPTHPRRHHDGIPHRLHYNIELDRYIQRTAIDCARRTFVAVKTTGYLKDKPVGTSREIRDWRIMTVPLPSDPTSNRIYQRVCGPAAPTSSPKPK